MMAKLIPAEGVRFLDPRARRNAAAQTGWKTSPGFPRSTLPVIVTQSVGSELKHTRHRQYSQEIKNIISTLYHKHTTHPLLSLYICQKKKKKKRQKKKHLKHFNLFCKAYPADRVLPDTVLTTNTPLNTSTSCLRRSPGHDRMTISYTKQGCPGTGNAFQACSLY